MERKFKSNRSFEDAKGSDTKGPRIDELVDQFKFPAKKWVQLRFMNPLVSYGTHWIEVKKKDGTKTKFPKQCLSYDPATEEHDSTKPCPWCDADDLRIQFGKEYYINAIVRDIEEDGPGKKSADPTKGERKSGFKDKESKTWTPMRVVRMTGGLVREIKKLGGLNRHKDKKSGEKKAFPVTHAKYGCDVSIMYDPDEKMPSKRFTVQKGDASPLTEEQNEYLMYQVEDLVQPDKVKDANAEFKRWLEKMGKPKKNKGEDSDSDDSDDDEDEDDDEDDEDEPKGKKKGKGKPEKAKKGKKKDDDDEDDADDDDDLDEEDDDDDDEDDEDTPKSKKSKGKPVKGKAKKSSKDDDEDSDDDEDDEDDEDTPKSKKSKAKPKKSLKDDDDYEEEDEDDEDDEPKSKKSKGKDKKPANGKKSKKDDDDEDDDLDDDDELDDDEEEDEDDEDEPKKKKGKSKSKAKPAKKGKKGKSKDDDDEDEDDDD